MTNVKGGTGFYTEKFGEEESVFWDDSRKGKEENKNMKTKIIGICVSMLLIATAIPAVTSVKNSAINTMAQTHPLTMPKIATTDPVGESFQNSAINIRIPRHTLTNMAGNWTETQKLTVPDAKTEYFGLAVSIDGDTAFIGAPGDDSDNGSVYVYTRTGTTWIQQQKLTPSDPGVDDDFGISVALNGDTALIGADDEMSVDSSGAAYVFTRSGTTWTEQQKLTPLDGAAGDYFGSLGSVSLSGDTALIGAGLDDDNGIDSGSAYVFTRTGTTWTQQAKLLASDGKTGDNFGFRVSLSGDTALIGRYADGLSTTESGHAYVFTRTGTTWIQQVELIGSDSAPGDSFGYAVSLDGDTAIVGAPNDDDNGNYSGTAFVFTRTGTIWTQQEKLLASDGTQWAWFGCDISLEGDTVLIGAADDYTNGAGEGSAYVFTRTGTIWTQEQKLVGSDSAPQDNFGWPVCLDGDTAFIGAWWDIIHGPNSGSVYVFINAAGNLAPVADFSWTPQNPIPTHPATFDASASHDPDGTITLYEWDWNNDGVYDEAHSSPTTTHTWTTVGSYPITVRVTDDDSATGTIIKTVNVNDTIAFTIKITGGFGIKAVIMNNGSITATNIQWTFTLTKGFIPLGKTKSGTIQSLAAGASAKARDIPLIGIGKTIIRINVTCSEGYTGTQSAIGSMFLFIVLVEAK